MACINNVAVVREHTTKYDPTAACSKHRGEPALGDPNSGYNDDPIPHMANHIDILPKVVLSPLNSANDVSMKKPPPALRQTNKSSATSTNFGCDIAIRSSLLKSNRNSRPNNC